MEHDALEEVLRAEVEALHAVFVRWFRGDSDPLELEREVAPRLAPGFWLVAPDGALLEREPLLGALSAMHGGAPALEIGVRSLRVRVERGARVGLTYEEHQRGSAREPGASARISSALLERRGPAWSWLFVHETWIDRS